MKKIMAVMMLVSASAFSQSVDANTEVVSPNRDGSVTIINPTFADPVGEGPVAISSHSSKDGVCKLYGYSSAVTGTLIKTSLDADFQKNIYTITAVKINNSGKIGGVIQHQTYTLTDNSLSCASIKVIKSIVCNR